MFTGIITHVGTVVKQSDTTLVVKTNTDLLNKLSRGTSIAVSGICLTVTAKDAKSFTVDVMPETAKKTNIRYLKIGDTINLELPATAQTLLSGHIVQGHVDTVVKILNIKKTGNSRVFTFSLPKDSSKYVVQKGSIAINGISVTVIDVGNDHCTVGIIPHTLKHTMLGTTKIGDYVNVEFDVLAKYIEKLIIQNA